MYVCTICIIVYCAQQSYSYSTDTTELCMIYIHVLVYHTIVRIGYVRVVIVTIYMTSVFRTSTVQLHTPLLQGLCTYSLLQ
jgi:hypothetical protein